MNALTFLKRLVVSLALLGAISAAFAFGLRVDVPDVPELAVAQAAAMFGTGDSTWGVLGALLLMGLIVKRKSRH